MGKIASRIIRERGSVKPPITKRKTAAGSKFVTTMGIEHLIEKVDIEDRDLKYIKAEEAGGFYGLQYSFRHGRFRYDFTLSHNCVMSKLFVNGVETQKVISPQELYTLRNVMANNEGLYPEELCYMTRIFGNVAVEVDSFNELWTKQMPFGRDFFVAPILIDENTRLLEPGKSVNDNHFITVAVTEQSGQRKLFIIDSNGATDREYCGVLSGRPGENVLSLNTEDIQGEDSAACGLFSFNICLEASKCKSFNEFKAKFPSVLRDIKERIKNTNTYKDLSIGVC